MLFQRGKNSKILSWKVAKTAEMTFLFQTFDNFGPSVPPNEGSGAQILLGSQQQKPVLSVCEGTLTVKTKENSHFQSESELRYRLFWQDASADEKQKMEKTHKEENDKLLEKISSLVRTLYLLS